MTSHTSETVRLLTKVSGFQNTYWSRAYKYAVILLLTSIQGDVPSRYVFGLIFNLLWHVVFLQDSSYLQMRDSAAQGSPSISVIKTPWEVHRRKSVRIFALHWPPPSHNTHPSTSSLSLHLHIPSTHKCSTSSLLLVVTESYWFRPGCHWWERRGSWSY